MTHRAYAIALRAPNLPPTLAAGDAKPVWLSSDRARAGEVARWMAVQHGCAAGVVEVTVTVEVVGAGLKDEVR